MKYSVFIEKSAQKSLAVIPQPFQKRIIRAIRSMSENPKPLGSKKLKGRDAWRIRIGSYRIIYEIHDGKLLVLVIIVGHRKDVYRQI